jgi:hypothetical protein
MSEEVTYVQGFVVPVQLPGQPLVFAHVPVFLATCNKLHNDTMQWEKECGLPNTALFKFPAKQVMHYYVQSGFVELE